MQGLTFVLFFQRVYKVLYLKSIVGSTKKGVFRDHVPILYDIELAPQHRSYAYCSRTRTAWGHGSRGTSCDLRTVGREL